MERLHLSVLSTETRTAAENMAADLAMRHALSPASPVVLRFYDWAEPSLSFGYFQRWVDVCKRLEAEAPVSVVRRPTGGGIVDHRSDVTYALVFARGTSFAEQKTTCLYEAVHTALFEALNELGEFTCLSHDAPLKATALSCFEAPVRSDIIDSISGLKIAGSAIHRGKESILVQGSLESKRLSKSLTPEDLSEAFAHRLGVKVGLASTASIPLFRLHVAAADVARFSNTSWTQRR